MGREVIACIGVACGIAFAAWINSLVRRSDVSDRGGKRRSPRLDAAVDKLCGELSLSTATLENIATCMVEQMQAGLLSGSEGLKMLPSYILKLPNGSESGSCLVQDRNVLIF